MPDAALVNVITSVLAGAVAGLITWGGMRVELRWLRRDVDLAHERIDELHEEMPVRDRVRVVERRTSRVRNRVKESRR